MISFEVAGEPAGQGALRTSASGHVYETTKGHRPWRQAVIAEAREAWAGAEPWLGAVRVDVEFIFPRPKNHFGTGRNAGICKPSAPYYHTRTPDLDHLQRSIGDALKLAGCIRDDAQIAAWRPEKHYHGQGEQVGARVTIYKLPDHLGGPDEW